MLAKDFIVGKTYKMGNSSEWYNWREITFKIVKKDSVYPYIQILKDPVNLFPINSYWRKETGTALFDFGYRHDIPAKEFNPEPLTYGKCLEILARQKS